MVWLLLPVFYANGAGGSVRILFYIKRLARA
jgi:hypothetical protein